MNGCRTTPWRWEILVGEPTKAPLRFPVESPRFPTNPERFAVAGRLVPRPMRIWRRAVFCVFSPNSSLGGQYYLVDGTVLHFSSSGTNHVVGLLLFWG